MREYVLITENVMQLMRRRGFNEDFTGLVIKANNLLCDTNLCDMIGTRIVCITYISSSTCVTVVTVLTTAII